MSGFASRAWTLVAGIDRFDLSIMMVSLASPGCPVDVLTLTAVISELICASLPGRKARMLKILLGRGLSIESGIRSRGTNLATTGRVTGEGLDEDVSFKYEQSSWPRLPMRAFLQRC